jgi:hypothetical protein
MMAARPDRGRRWVLLAYRMPREPSTPRIAVWRKLEQIGVARLGDGLVAVPADARTREQIDWIAEEIRHADGTASVWLATTDPAHEQALVDAARTARAQEYQAVLAEARAAATTAGPERTRALRRLRGQLRRINRRDFFTAPHHDEARTAVEALASDGPAATPPSTMRTGGAAR